jgi:hypothetical protein
MLPVYYPFQWLPFALLPSAVDMGREFLRSSNCDFLTASRTGSSPCSRAMITVQVWPVEAVLKNFVPEGDYQVSIDFANAEKRNTNIQGLVARLDVDGGNYREIVRFNEIDVSSRKTQTFRVRDGRTVLYVMNTNDVVRYTMRVTESSGRLRPTN